MTYRAWRPSVWAALLMLAPAVAGAQQGPPASMEVLLTGTGCLVRTITPGASATGGDLVSARRLLEGVPTAGPAGSATLICSGGDGGPAVTITYPTAHPESPWSTGQFPVGRDRGLTVTLQGPKNGTAYSGTASLEGAGADGRPKGALELRALGPRGRPQGPMF